MDISIYDVIETIQAASKMLTKCRDSMELSDQVEADWIIKDLDSHKSSLETSWNKLESEIVELKEEVDDLKEVNGDFKEEIKTLNEKIQELEDQLE